MNLQISSALLLLALSAKAQYQHHLVHSDQAPAAEYGLRIHHDESTPVDYNYSYDVRDDITGDRKSQEESRYGDQVRGRYSTLDADGSTRTVEYSVDSLSGFNAVVRRDGEQVYFPSPVPSDVLVNQYHSRNPDLSELLRSSSHPLAVDGRTRLAQDVRTGNVVDLQSGFGIYPHARSDVRQSELPRIHHTNDAFDDTVHNQADLIISHRHDGHREHDIQEVYARTQYQASHPTNHHLSTAPVHFPNHRSTAYPSRSALAYDRYSIRPVEVRRPVALFRSANTEQENANNENTQHINGTVYPTVQYPAQHGGFIGSTTPGPIQSTVSSTPSVAQHSRIALLDQQHSFGDRFDINEHPEQSISNGASAHFSSAVERSDIPNIHQNSADHIINTNLAISAERNIYPASTIPLNSDTPAHFFTGQGISHGISSLLSNHNFGIQNPLFKHVTVEPVHYSEPIQHSVNLI